MAENLREVIARIKQQNSQAQTKPKAVEVAPTPKPVEDDEGEEEFDADIQDEAEENLVAKEKTTTRQANSTNTSNTENSQDSDSPVAKSRELAEQVATLQNSGIFRLELLGQLSEINKALVVIAGQLVSLNEK